MRLKKLQISGFKSFVDVTDIRLPADWVAVVGPNGCGKSNVIDAVRWVMGETSAKMLRGDSMTDVIFNGSTSRKPVGKAAVELLFDNSDGSAGGNFAQFGEISIKRTLSRDGNSNYFINRIKTRRRDVLDLFRGTGLGPRSYSIIEQGMVSRIVEARPDDLRNFVEEAAGTSKYKERRRETENRIARTRENLARMTDIRDELSKQLGRLKRQASAAKRYQKLKEQERGASGQLLALQLQALQEKLQECEGAEAEHGNQLQVAVAAQRESEARIDELRQQLADSHAEYSAIQETHYRLEAQVKSIEQRIVHMAETKQRQGEEIERLQSSREEIQRRLAAEQARLGQLQAEQDSTAPENARCEDIRQQADAQVADAERAVADWQQQWDAFGEQAQAPARQQEVQKSRIAQLQQHLERSAEQCAQLEGERAESQQLMASMDVAAQRAAVDAHDEVCERGELEFHRTEEAIQRLRQAVQQQRDDGAAALARLREARSRLSSLLQIQAATLQGDDQVLAGWLMQNGLGQPPKLATKIRVDDGWERAADRLLSGCLSAACVEKLPANGFDERPDCAFTLLTESPSAARVADAEASKHPRLLDKVRSDGVDLSGFLGGVYAADSLPQALAMQPSLGHRQCAVTRDGVLVGANWVSFASQSQLETGVLAREEEIKQLQGGLGAREAAIAHSDAKLAEVEAAREAQQQTGAQQRAALNQLGRDKTKMHSALGREEARYLEVEQRIEAIGGQLDSLGEHAHSDRGDIDQAQELLRSAADQRGALEAQRDELLRRKEALADTLRQCKDALKSASQQAHQSALAKQRLEAELTAAAAVIARFEHEFQAAAEQMEKLIGAANTPAESSADLSSRLQVEIARRQETQRQLAALAEARAALEQHLAQTDAQRLARVDAVDAAQKTLEARKLARREMLVRRDTQAERLQSHGHDATSLVANLPDGVDIASLEARGEELARKIHRIGPINLIAIEEFDEQSERKNYLDHQHADLSEALETLQSVIRKIDRETRSRFKETFERLNAGFNDFFPQLFGGGEAGLQLTSDDFLTAGVVVMARPPGKRNSHIHLLSGGEKALTAVALLFSLFKLNPAPFCMLDEVDAPLDDVNVARYCETLKNLVKVSQMIVITHNKITMAAADVLIGVTMSEPGVSRLVSVDIDQAVEMAKSAA